MATLPESLLQLHCGPPTTQSFYCKTVNFVLFMPLPNPVSLLVPPHKNHHNFHLHYHWFCKILGTTQRNHLYQNHISKQYCHLKFHWKLSVAEIYHATTLQWYHHDMEIFISSSLFFIHMTAECFMNYCYCVTDKEHYISVVADLNPHVTIFLGFINTSCINQTCCWMHGAW